MMSNLATVIGHGGRKQTGWAYPHPNILSKAKLITLYNIFISNSFRTKQRSRANEKYSQRYFSALSSLMNHNTRKIYQGFRFSSNSVSKTIQLNYFNLNIILLTFQITLEYFGYWMHTDIKDCFSATNHCLGEVQ